MDEKMETVSIKEIYSSLTSLVIHTQSIIWNRFYNFLAGNSILLVILAIIFSSINSKALKVQIANILICILGIFGCYVWACLGKRGKDYLDKYIGMGYKIETKESGFWTDKFNDYKPFTIIEETGTNKNKFIAGNIVKYGPWGFLFLYVPMLGFSIINICIKSWK